MASPPSDPDMRHHERFYFSDGSLYLTVEQSLYRVHRSLFEIHASKFPACILDTSSSETLFLKDVKKVDFDRLLACLYPRALLVEEAKSTEEWISILKLASKWGFENLQSRAMSKIEHTLASPVNMVVFGRQYNIPDILFLGYTTLCQGTTPLSSEEGRRLGVEDVINIYRIRHELYGSVVAPVSFEEALKKVRISLSNEEQEDEKELEAKRAESDLSNAQSSEWTDARSVAASPILLPEETASLSADSRVGIDGSDGHDVGSLYADSASQTSSAGKDRETLDSASNTSADVEGSEDASISPKRPLSAYMFFCQDWRQRIKAENPDAGFGEVGKLLGAKWKELDDEGKQAYVERAAQDKSRAEKAEKATASPEGKTVPKRPLSPYMFFSQDWRERIKTENPGAGFGEIGKLLGAKWKELDDEGKKAYVERAAQDKNRAEKEKEEYTSTVLGTPLDSTEGSEVQEDPESEEERFDECSSGGLPTVGASSSRSSSIPTVASSDIDVPESSGPAGQVFRFLDELTINNFDPVTKKIIQWFKALQPMPNSLMLYQITQSIVEKATTKQSGQLCVLVRLCQEMVTRLANVQVKDPKGKIASGGLLFRDYLSDICHESLKSAGERTAKVRRLFLVEFISKLAKPTDVKIWTLAVIDRWVAALLDDNDEEKVVTLSILMTHAGPLWDKSPKKKIRTHVNGWFHKMSNVANKTSKHRVRTLLQEVIRRRNLGWVAK